MYSFFLEGRGTFNHAAGYRPCPLIVIARYTGCRVGSQMQDTSKDKMGGKRLDYSRARRKTKVKVKMREARSRVEIPA